MTPREGQTVRYRDYARRYRRLLCIPPLVAMVLAALVVAMSGKSYASSTSLWVDNPPQSGSSLSGNASSTAATDPSSSVESVLSELLTTQTFAVSVAQSSSLGSYLAPHANGSFSDSEVTEILNELQNNVTLKTPGAQFLTITYNGPTPEVAQSVVNSLVKQLEAQTSSFNNSYAKAGLSYYEAQAKSAQEALATARQQATEYLSEHPHSTTANDPTYAVLSAAVQSANTQLSQAEQNIEQAQSGVTSGANSYVVKTYDAANLPTSPTTGKKKIALAGFAGLLGGLLISALIVAILTPARRDPIDDELAAWAETAPRQGENGSDPHHDGQENSKTASLLLPDGSKSLGTGRSSRR